MQKKKFRLDDYVWTCQCGFSIHNDELHWPGAQPAPRVSSKLSDAADEVVRLVRKGMSVSDAIAKVSEEEGGVDWDELYDEAVKRSGGRVSSENGGDKAAVVSDWMLEVLGRKREPVKSDDLMELAESEGYGKVEVNDAIQELLSRDLVKEMKTGLMSSEIVAISISEQSLVKEGRGVTVGDVADQKRFTVMVTDLLNDRELTLPHRGQTLEQVVGSFKEKVKQYDERIRTDGSIAVFILDKNTDSVIWNTQNTGRTIPVVAAFGDGQGVGGPPQGLGGVDHCSCPDCEVVVPHEKGTPCNTVPCPECNLPMQGLLPEAPEAIVGGRIAGREYSSEEWVEFFLGPRVEPSKETKQATKDFEERIEQLLEEQGTEYDDIHQVSYLSYGSLCNEGTGLWEGREDWHGDFEKIVKADTKLRNLQSRLEAAMYDDKVEAGVEGAD